MHGDYIFCFVLIDLIKKIRGTKITKIFTPVILFYGNIYF